MILNQVHYRVQASVNCSAVVILVAEVLSRGLFLIFRDMDRMTHQFFYTLILRGGNRNHRRSEECFHCVYVDHAAVLIHFIHHVESDYNRDVHFQQLHGQIQIPLNIGRVHDIDDRLRLFIQDKVSRDQFLFGVGRHGVDARKIRDQSIFMTEDHAVFAIHRNSRKISHMLPRPGQRVEKGRLAAVLISDKRKRQNSALGQRIPASLWMIDSFFSQTRMRCLFVLYFLFLFGSMLVDRLHPDLGGIVKTQREGIAVDLDFHRIP